MQNKIRSCILIFSLLAIALPASASPLTAPLPAIRQAPDHQLQQQLEQRIARLHLSQAVRDKRLAIALVDLSNPATPALAQVNGDEMMYAASLPKIAVLLTAFELIQQGKLPLNEETRTTMTRMIRYSSNADATAMINMVGKDYINQVMESPKYRLYDPEHNGGLWVGKEYAQGVPFHRDPLHHLSHGATAIQVARFYYMLEKGRLVSPRYSAEMKEIMSNPGINHKFVKGLDAMHNPDIQMYRKSGSWRNWHADSALIEHHGHSYIAVALADDPRGGVWMTKLIREMDDIIESPRASFVTARVSASPARGDQSRNSSSVHLM
ncbi:serine hydrolase [Mariprofundus erugo]|uniref:beta-lactamase n=1 Tax=Mariprofundus erugo TaxID=2528639 RepID=A0A5R9GTQ7_9PROT|nr:serine hydrolase [Mariprofundus erugo]TLS69230.1 serine hydrolase [Mariprofundus erugo]TLS75336.1 serine hydrolase [Mariprofundus erugo]